MDNLAADFIIQNNNSLQAEYNLTETETFDCSFEVFAAGTVWGSIAGTLSNQTDLQAALNLKADKTELDADIEEVNSTISDLESVVNNNYTTLDNKIDGVESDLAEDISALSQTVEENNAAVNNRIDETNDTVSNLSDTVTSNYNTLDGKVDSEISSRTLADTTLQNNIDAEALARQNADATLQGNIDTLSDTVSSNYNDLSNQIDNLSDTVSSNYTTLDNKIDNTKTSLEGDISDLSDTVSQNYTDLSNAITTSASTINSRIDSEVSTLNTAIGTETTTRQNADNNLQSQIDAIVSSSDVFDIVGTYAELQAYDISTVPVNDIIKVLVDSSHDGAATYYRCVETAGVKSWSYIGSEGAYYTKSESDTKFVAKTTTINNKPLSTASDVNALPNTTVIGDGVLTLQKNGVNIDTFNANATANKSINITVPTDTADLTNGAGFITSASLPTVNNGTLTIQANGITVGTFTANQAGNTTANIVVPDSATWGNITGTLSNQTDLQNALEAKYDASNPNNYTSVIESTVSGWGFTKNTGTVTSVNNVSPVSGNVTLSIPTDTSDLTNGAMYIPNTATGFNSITIYGTAASQSQSINIGNSSSVGQLGVAIGHMSYSSDYGTAIGRNATASQSSCSFGYNSYCRSVNAITIGARSVVGFSSPRAIQIGEGTNSTANSLAIGFGNDANDNPLEYQLLDGVTGLIPDARISSNIARTSNTLPSSTKYGADLSYNSNTLQLLDQDGNNLGSSVTIQSSPDIDGKSITTNVSDELQTVGVIDQNNTTNAIKTWTGTQAEFDAITTKDPTTLYNVTDTDPSYSVNTQYKNIGAIVQSVVPLTDAGLHLLDGSLIQMGAYSEFVEYMADLYGDGTSIPSYFCTESEWQTAVTTYGVCGKFVYDSVNNTVRLPKYNSKIYTGGGTAPVVGNDVNICFVANYTGYTPTDTGFYVSSGNIRAGAYVSEKGSEQGAALGNWNSISLTTDTTKSGIIAQLSDITTSLDGYYYIVIATSTKTEIQVDIDEIATDLNGKADTDLSNINASQSAKNEIVSWGMPDWSATVEITSSFPYTCPSDGYLYLRNFNGGIEIGSNVNTSTYGYRIAGTSSQSNTTMFPVQFNEILTLSFASGSSNMYFIPLKGVN